MPWHLELLLNHIFKQLRMYVLLANTYLHTHLQTYIYIYVFWVLTDFGCMFNGS